MSHGSMVLTYQQLLLGHSIVSRRDRSCEKCAVIDDENAVRVRRGQQQPDCWAVVPVPCGFARYAGLAIRPL